MKNKEEKEGMKKLRQWRGRRRRRNGRRTEWRWDIEENEEQEEEGLKDRWIKRRDGWIRTRGWERQIRDKGRYEITCNDNQ